jgi:hypothetical protein
MRDGPPCDPGPPPSCPSGPPCDEAPRGQEVGVTAAPWLTAHLAGTCMSLHVRAL